MQEAPSVRLRFLSHWMSNYTDHGSTFDLKPQLGTFETEVLHTAQDLQPSKVQQHPLLALRLPVGRSSLISPMH